VKGLVATDEVRIRKDSAKISEGFAMLLVTEAKNLSALVTDGLLGLAPRMPVTGKTTLVDELYRDGVIKLPMFSMQLELDSAQSSLWFGGFDYDVIRRKNPEVEDWTNDQLYNLISWTSLNGDFFWQSQFYDVEIERVSQTTALIKTIPNLIVDSGASLNHIPTADYTPFMTELTRG
jgi:hypothetical protein